MFPTNSKPVTVLSWASAAFFIIAVWRAGTNFLISWTSDDLWQHAWIEFGILSIAGLILALIAFLLSQREHDIRE